MLQQISFLYSIKSICCSNVHILEIPLLIVIKLTIKKEYFRQGKMNQIVFPYSLTSPCDRAIYVISANEPVKLD